MTRESLFSRVLPDGRLHLQEGPIDLVIEAFGAADEVRRAYAAAAESFTEVLPGLVAELPALRSAAPYDFRGPVARRMAAACAPHRAEFVTPMAAVAGAVADHVLTAMTEAADLTRAYVNDGGDIALHLAPGETFACGLVAEVDDPRLNGRAVVAAQTPVRGIATSGRATLGQGGRSFSLGIADAVTVFARTAAEADVAATLIANAVDLPGHAAVRRQPANEIDPDSDLGERLVTTGVGALAPEEIKAALARGEAEARRMQAAGLIEAAVLFLRGEAEVVGDNTLLLPSDAGARHSRISDSAGSPLAAQRVSSRGLSPGPIALSVQSIVEVFPLGIATLDQADLPGARPLLHRFLALDGTGDLFVNLDIDETGDTVSLDEAGAAALAVFPDTASDVVGDAYVERPVLAAGKDVNIVGHGPALTPMGPGNKCRDDRGVYSGNEPMLEDA